MTNTNELEATIEDLRDMEEYLIEQLALLRKTPWDDRDGIYEDIGGICEQILALRRQVKVFEAETEQNYERRDL
jgi:hypothetical protein